MKTIFIVRHGEAEPHQVKPDFDRELVTAGVLASRRVAEWLRESCKRPGIFLSSPAPRALETAEEFADAFEVPRKDICTNRILYDGDGDDFIPLVTCLDDAVDTVLIFGHNPSISRFASLLARGYTASIPKSGVVEVTFEVDQWREVPSRAGRVVLEISPKRIPDKKNAEKPEIAEQAEEDHNGTTGRNELAGRLEEGMRKTLETIDPETAGKMGKSLRKASDKVAKTFMKKLG